MRGGQTPERIEPWRHKLDECIQLPRRAIVVSAPPPDPRAVEVAHHPPGQADVQNSLPGRHEEGRARSKGVLRARPFLSRFSDTPQGPPAGPAKPD